MSRLSQIWANSNVILSEKRKTQWAEQGSKRSYNRFRLPKLSEGDQYFGVSKLEAFRKEDKEKFEGYVLRTKLQTRTDISTDPLRDLGYSSGDATLAKIRYWLNNLDNWKRSADQILFHEHFLIACLPHIYGKDWNANGARVMASMGISAIDYEVLCQTPRRFGKTISVAMFVAVLALMRPGIKISIFSTGSRASKSMVDMVLKFVNYIPGGSQRKIKHSKEELMFSAKPLGAKGGPGSALAKAAEHADDTTVIKSYPASVDSKSISKHYFLFSINYLL